MDLPKEDNMAETHEKNGKKSILISWKNWVN